MRSQYSLLKNVVRGTAFVVSMAYFASCNPKIPEDVKDDCDCKDTPTTIYNDNRTTNNIYTNKNKNSNNTTVTKPYSSPQPWRSNKKQEQKPPRPKPTTPKPKPTLEERTDSIVPCDPVVMRDTIQILQIEVDLESHMDKYYGPDPVDSYSNKKKK